jgi:hypothetical protein
MYSRALGLALSEQRCYTARIEHYFYTRDTCPGKPGKIRLRVHAPVAAVLEVRRHRAWRGKKRSDASGSGCARSARRHFEAATIRVRLAAQENG